jgi:hypothetical protein
MAKAPPDGGAFVVQCEWLPAQIIAAKIAAVKSIRATAKMSGRSITRAGCRARLRGA